MASPSTTPEPQPQPAQLEQEEEFDALRVARLAVLSRLVETIRFTSGYQFIQKKVTRETLIEAFHEHSKTTGCSDTVRRRYTKQLMRMWDDMAMGCLTALKDEVTFGYLFDFEFPMFPELDADERAKLVELGETQELITKQDVMFCLNCEPDNQVIDFIFAAGTDVLPSEVFLEICSCLDKHPAIQQFAQQFVSIMAERGKRMQPFLPYIIVLIMILVVAPSMAPRAHMAVHENIIHFGDNDWETGCPRARGTAPNASIPGGCDLLGKQFFTMSKPDIDVMQYMRRQLILDLWPKRQEELDARKTALDVALGNVQLVGALVIRYARQTSAGTERPEACSQNGVKARVPHFEVHGYYDCDADWSVEIPFNVTREEALQMAADGVRDLPLTAPPDHSAVIAQFVAFAPTSEAVIHARFIASLPRGGGVIPRALVSTFDDKGFDQLLPVVIVKLLSSVWEVAWVIVFARAGIPWYDDWALYADVATSLIGILALGLLGSISLPSIAELGQGSYFPNGVDTVADRYEAGMSVTGFFFILCILTLLRFARDIRGLDFLYDILRTAMVEILATVGIFIVWCFGFTVCAMLLFGGTVEQFSSVRLAWQTLMLFFFNEDDFGSLVDNAPVVGTMYYFLYSVFVVFFALNVLVAIITAPLTLIRGQRGAVDTALDHAEERLPADASRVAFYLKRYIVWPIVNVVMCSSPFAKYRWFKIQRAMRTFYDPQAMRAEDEAVRDAFRVSRLVFGASDKLKEDDDRDVTPEASFSPLDPALRAGNSTGAFFTPISSGAFNSTSNGGFNQSNMESFQEGLFHQSACLQPKGWDSPLCATVIADALISPDSALSLVLATIAAESPITVVRDARLLIALRRFADHEIEMRKVNTLQETLKAASVNQQESAARLLYGEPDEPRRSKRASVAGDLTSLGGSRAPSTIFGRRKSSRATATMKSGGFDENGMIIQPSGGMEPPVEPLASAAVTNPMAGPTETRELSPRNGTISSGAHNDTANGRRESTAVPHQYSAFFLSIVDARISHSNQFLFYALTTLIFTMFYFVPYFSHEDSTAWLTRSLSTQLAHGDLLTGCQNVNCTAGLTYNKTFDDTGDLQEFYDYLKLGFTNFIWFRKDHGLPGGDEGALWFDSRIRLESPLTVRQIRGVEVPCTGTASQLSSIVKRRLRCFVPRGDDDHFAKHFWVPDDGTGNASRPFHDPLAYRWSPTCSDARQELFWGQLDDYECNGFSTTVHNASELAELLDSKWFDSYTRLATISGTFNFGSENAVRFSLLLELAENGGGAKPKWFAEARRSDANLRTLSVRLIILYVVVAAHALWYVFLVVRYGVERWVRKRPAEEVVLLRPEFPLTTMLAVAWLVLGNNIAFPDPDDPNRSIAIGLASVLYIMITFSTQNMFPIAALVSKEVQTLVLTLAKAVVQVFYVLPFFMVFMLAFTMGGIVTFGRYVPQFSTARWSFLQVSYFTFSENFDMQMMQRGRAQEAQIYAVLMLFTILITLNNVFLAMVTSACGDAQFTKGNVAQAELTLRYYNKHIIYGRFVGFLLTIIKFIEDEGGQRVIPKILRIVLPKFIWAPRRFDETRCTYQMRILFPVESVLTTFPPLRCNEILRHMRSTKCSEMAFAAMLPFVLESYNDYQRTFPHRAAEDDTLNRTREAIVCAEIATIRPAAPERDVKPSLSMLFGSGVFSQGGHMNDTTGPSSPFAPSPSKVAKVDGGLTDSNETNKPAPLLPSVLVEGTEVMAMQSTGQFSSPSMLGQSSISSMTTPHDAGWAVFRKSCREAGVSLSSNLWHRLRAMNIDDESKLTLMETFDEFFTSMEQQRMRQNTSTYLSGASNVYGGSSLGSQSEAGGRRQRGQRRNNRKNEEKKKKVTFGNVLV